MQDIKKFFKIIFIFALVVASFYFVQLNSIAGHEQIHKKIFTRYNIKSEIHTNYFLQGKVIPNSSEYYKCNDECKTQHTLNDVIHYEMDNLFLSIWVIFIIFLVYKTWINKK